MVQKHKPFHPPVSVSRIIPTTGPSHFLACNNNSESIALWKRYWFQRKPPSVQNEPPDVPFWLLPLLEVL